MKNDFRFFCVTFASTALLILCPAIAKEPQAQVIVVRAPITVRANGRVEIGDIEKLDGALEDIVRSELLKKTYSPAKIDNHHVDSTSHVSANVTLSPAENQKYTIIVNLVRIEPIAISREVPVVKVGRLIQERSGYAILETRIETDGRISVLDSSRASAPAFGKAARMVVEQWRYEPTIINGQPVSIEATFVASFNPSDLKERPQYRCIWDEKRPLVEPQDVCLDEFSLETKRVRTQIINLPSY